MSTSNLHDSEKWLEREVVKHVSKRGGMAIKITASTTNGLPDRLILWPGGVAEFVELKSRGKEQTIIQALLFTVLRSIGFRCTVINNEEKLIQWQNSTPGRTKPK